MVRKHNCPYLENGCYCSHKVTEKLQTRRRRMCGFNHPINCGLFKDSRSELKNGVKKQEELTEPPLEQELGVSDK